MQLMWTVTYVASGRVTDEWSLARCGHAENCSMRLIYYNIYFSA